MTIIRERITIIVTTGMIMYVAKISTIILIKYLFQMNFFFLRELGNESCFKF